MAEEIQFDIQEELKKLPARPGVYLMHDERDAIIYVGKAISLRNRVRQYFQAGYNRSPKIEQMVSRIRRFEYIVTDSELEALVLENNLIKEHRPKYNTMLTDDKTYPFIKVTVGEEYPRVFLTRQMKKDKARYFGPFSSAWAVRDTIDLIRKLYHLRDCSRSLPKDIGNDRPCLYYHIKQCDGPCMGYISKEAYNEKVEQALDFLSGNYKPVISMLEKKMQEASEQMDFDIRGGRVIGRDHYWIRIGLNDSRATILGSFIQQFYAGTPYIPRELMLETEAEEQELLEKWLTAKRGSRVYLRVPRRGTKEKLVEMAKENAQIVLRQDRERIKREEGRTIGAVKEIQELLGMDKLVRMEAYDISNISGYESVGSMVVFEKGKPKRSDYRKFRIRTVEGPNDYASMEEVLTRRFTHGLEGKKQMQEDSFSSFPDLILMDGGRGQVNVAERVMENLGINIEICGMVKDDYHRTRGIYYKNKELPIDTHSEGFKLITRIQDEAHRFAIEYHRSLRSKAQVHSVLDDIPGIGETRRKALMKHFPSIEEIRSADEETLAAVPSMNAASAAAVYMFFHPAAKPEAEDGYSSGS